MGTGPIAERATSVDGTRIGFHRVGHGPGLVLVQGAMGTAHNYANLAAFLASDFTVITPDRRGRGMSPAPFVVGHAVERDVEDIEAVLAATGAELVFGLSSGAMIALEAARTLPQVRRVAAFEPPFYPNGIDRRGISRFNADVKRGDFASALVIAGRIVGLAPPPVRLLPKPIARLVTGSVIRRDDRGKGPYARLRTLIPAMRFDFEVVAGMNDCRETLGDLLKPVLILSGTRSPRYLRDAARALAKLIPGASRIEFDGLDHAGPWNTDRGGHPKVVADAMREFFLVPHVSDYRG